MLDEVAAQVGLLPPWVILLTAAALVVVALGLLAWGVRGAGSAIGRALQANPTARTSLREAWSGQAKSWLFGLIVAIVMSLSAQGMVKFLESIGMAAPWTYLGFVAFDGMAAILAITLFQRAERGEAATGLRAAIWGLIGMAAWFNASHAPGSLTAKVAYAAFPIVAAIGLEVLLQEQRKKRDHLKRQAGQLANRRVAVIRWLHPIERVRVLMLMAADEHIGADEATVRVRSEHAAWRLFRLRQAQGRTGRLAHRRLVAAERRAQRALKRAELAIRPDMPARVLRQVQVLTQAPTLAALDYSTPEQARSAVGNLITSVALVDGAGPVLLELEAAQTSDSTPDRTPDPDPTPEPVPTPDPHLVEELASLPKADAVRRALKETGDSAPKALEWLKFHGIKVDRSYAYDVKSGRSGRKSRDGQSEEESHNSELKAVEAA